MNYGLKEQFIMKLQMIYVSNSILVVSEKHFKDLVVPMILSGLTMNFMLYEKDYGLAIANVAESRRICFSECLAFARVLKALIQYK